MSSYPKIEDMVGKTYKAVDKAAEDSLIFTAETGEVYEFYHEQDCCEFVRIADICGDLDDLAGSPLLMAEEVSSDGAEVPSSCDESYTWTFYKFATNKGAVTVRWLGESNGYYSESVDFRQIDA